MDAQFRWCCLVALASIGACGKAQAADNAPPPAAPYMRPQAAVRLPDGRRFNMVCSGQGAPVAILYAGLGGWSPTWREAQPELSKITRTCAVDPAGYGFSDAGPMPRDAAAEVSDLYLALKASGMPGPFVLVGHSIGGMEMRLFAYKHPELVSGLLLIDPSIERDDVRLNPSKDELAPWLEFYRYCAAQSRAGKLIVGEDTPGGLGPCVPPSNPKRTDEERRALFEVYALPSHFDAAASEMLSTRGRNSHEIQAARRKLGSVPLVVLSEDKAHFGSPTTPGAIADHAYENWIAAHEDVAAESKHGRHRIVEGAGHWIYGDRPDAVITAFREVIEEARSSGRTAAN
jgi:pimeloyl-ACP methyl ester carboxylesterase